MSVKRSQRRPAHTPPHTAGLVALGAFLALGLGASSVSAQEYVDAAAADEQYVLPPPENEAPTLQPPPGWAVGIDAYGGFALLATSGNDYAHALAGGLARVRWGYIQAGGTAEMTDTLEDRWRAFGGFVGVFLPFDNWVDMQASLGAGGRTYSNSDARYGPGGYELSSPVLNLRMGVSDRSSEGRFGGRVGAEFVAAFDLSRHSADWRRETPVLGGAPIVVTGVTDVGGFSFGLVMTLGFDVNLNRRRPSATAEKAGDSKPL